jgi:hypothetical protein
VEGVAVVDGHAARQAMRRGRRAAEACGECSAFCQVFWHLHALVLHPIRATRVRGGVAPLEELLRSLLEDDGDLLVEVLAVLVQNHVVSRPARRSLGSADSPHTTVLWSIAGSM